MRIVKTIKELRSLINQERRCGHTIGFVPTMGYVHEGHLSLMRRARHDCDCIVVSIYVNPKQFDSTHDLRQYPRELKRDATMIAKENVDILFIPSDNTVYPQGYLTTIDVEKLSSSLCGHYRPGHFRGVATVVVKLLHMTSADRMYLGQKDAQQAAILKRLVADLNFSVQITLMPTVREKDGLAMSSRNVHLTDEERAQAPVLYRALAKARRALKSGVKQADVLTDMVRQEIKTASRAKIQYVACVDAETLEPLKMCQGKVLIALSVFFGKTRLIDNVIVSLKDPKKIKN